MNALEIRNLIAGYGAQDVLKGVSLTVAPGEIVVVVGPNGAGKSTALKAAAGVAIVRSGSIRLGGEDIAGLTPERAAARGLGFTPQTDNVFPSLSVDENLSIGAILNPKTANQARERVYGLFPDLRDHRSRPAGRLSGGQRQMVAMGRALMAAPKLLMLDEPTAGLSPAMTAHAFRMVERIREDGLPILMVEQNAKAALKIADRGYVLVGGRNRAEGPAADLLADPEIGRLFLGG